ncbi:MAG: hypothetical protein HGB26_05920 [Desulfobulbaceae bacterium]|nr:hypothetical protein [Desulfobulbaceae bacterium]
METGFFIFAAMTKPPAFQLTRCRKNRPDNLATYGLSARYPALKTLLKELTTKKKEREMRWNASKGRREENKLVYGPEPRPKYLTTRGLIIRGIIFLAAISGICYLLWREFSGK